MEKRTLIIIFATLLLFALGGVGAHFIFTSLEQEKGTETTQITERISQPKEVSTQPEETTSPPKEPTTTESVDTSDWKTYRNEKYGFAFEYPPTWQNLGEWGNSITFDVEGDTGTRVLDVWQYYDDVTVKAFFLSKFLEAEGVKTFEEWWDTRMWKSSLLHPEESWMGFRAAVEGVRPFKVHLFWVKSPLLLEIILPGDFKHHLDEKGNDRSKEYIGMLQSLKLLRKE